MLCTMAHSDETTATAVQSRVDAKATPPKLTLVVTDGADRGRTLAIDGSQPGRVLVGQAETCALRLTDPEVSRRHFALDPAPEGVRITDLGSTNGTFVDRVRVVEGLLSGGEILLVGTTAIRVDVVEGTLPSPPDAA